jgi:RNA polymerase sigma-70 factor (ECF subfamily)
MRSSESDKHASEPAASGSPNWELFLQLQQELRRIARAKMTGERREHTLQPTALINEAFLRLFKNGEAGVAFEDDRHAVHTISLAMERVLMDYAESRGALKRGGPAQQRVDLHEIRPATGVEPAEQILSVRKALEQLKQIAPRQAQVVELQYYGGLTQDEIAALLEVSVETVKLDWRKAKGFLKLVLTAAE